MKVIPSSIANPFIKAHHYSGKVVNNSKLHFGVFLDGQLHGVMSYGPSLDKSKIIGLVEGTGWNEFLELNRMAFDSVLPRNSESRAISMSIKLLKKYAPQVKWIISFADACSCGDGTIYRASNFILTGIKENLNLAELPDGTRELLDLDANFYALGRDPEDLYAGMTATRGWEWFNGVRNDERFQKDIALAKELMDAAAKQERK